VSASNTYSVRFAMLRCSHRSATVSSCEQRTYDGVGVYYFHHEWRAGFDFEGHVGNGATWGARPRKGIDCKREERQCHQGIQSGGEGEAAKGETAEEFKMIEQALRAVWPHKEE
jgi:hypothetical protein